VAIARLAVDESRGEGVTWLDAAQAAQVGYEAARHTVDNMARAGELVRVGSAKPEGSRHWMALYVLANPGEPEHEPTPQPWGGIEVLADVMKSFPVTEPD
jgi:hypothetical protein